MSIIRKFDRQITRLKYFRRLFPIGQVARNTLTLPLDYLSPSGWAHPPMVINILITHKCDLKCRMCYAEELKSRRIRDMSAADVERIVEDTLPFRPTFFLSGGEPCARPDILEVVEAVKRHGLPLGMVSNAMQLTPERSERLVELGLDQLVVSLTGPPDIHDEITGIKGSFDRASKNIKAMCSLEGRPEVMLNLVVSREILDRLPEMVDIGRSLGVDRVRFHHLLFMTPEEIERHNGKCLTRFDDAFASRLEPTLYFCSMDDVMGFEKDVPAALEAIQRKTGSFVIQQPDLSESEVGAWYTTGFDNTRRCLFVWRSLFIDPEGYAIPCQHYGGMRFGNVLERPFMEVWNDPDYMRFRRELRRGLLQACSRCCKL